MKVDSSLDKLVYQLDEISRITHLDPKTIEDWEKEFYFLNAGQTGKGKKIFRKRDLDIISRLKELVEGQHLTLAGAKRRIEFEFGIKSGEPPHPERMKKILHQIRDQLQDIASDLKK
jgi:DNA-binding transcriptional MerR regulator